MSILEMFGNDKSFSFTHTVSTDAELNEEALKTADQRLRDARIFLDREFGPA